MYYTSHPFKVRRRFRITKNLVSSLKMKDATTWCHSTRQQALQSSDCTMTTAPLVFQLLIYPTLKLVQVKLQKVFQFIQKIKTFLTDTSTIN